MKTKIEEMRELLNVQALNGNWDYNQYMQGMYNGMELMLAIAEGREPVYKGEPEQWLCDKEINLEPTEQEAV